MELPKKPSLEYEEKTGQHGEIIQQLTPESERIWSNYLTELAVAKRALYKANKKQTNSNRL